MCENASKVTYRVGSRSHFSMPSTHKLAIPPGFFNHLSFIHHLTMASSIQNLPRDIYAPDDFPLRSLQSVWDAFDSLFATTHDDRTRALKDHWSEICTMCNEGIKFDADWETICRHGCVNRRLPLSFHR